MSLNYCEQNPVQGLRNQHCFHDVRSRARRRDGTFVVEMTCCWCNEKAVREEFSKHGPFPKMRKPKRPRKAKRR